MAYSLSTDHPECAGFAVVDDEGEMDSCHETEEAAQARLDELNAEETPPPPPGPVSAGRYIQAAFFDPNAVITASLGEEGVESRTISGVAVPWNKVGRVGDGSLVKFLPGSLDAAARPVVSLGHDSAKPIGRVISNKAGDIGMGTKVKVSAVRDGDEALVLASDGVLGMFSVGVNPTEFTIEMEDGEPVMVVAAGEWQHLALLPYGAFDDALVTNVAASAPTQGDTSMPETLPGTVTTEAPAAAVEAGPTPVPITGAPAPVAPLTINRVAAIIAQGNQEGLRAADVQARIQAALTNVTTANVPSPPNYRTELVGLIDHGAPLPSRLQQRPLPETGMEILYPQWGAFPDSTAKQVGEKTPIASGDVSWTWKTNPIETWAQGNDLSLQAVQRSNPSAMDAYLRAAGIDAAKKWDINVQNKLMAGGNSVAEGANFLETLKNLLGGLNPANVPPGRVWVATQYAEMLDMITVTGLDGPAYFNVSLSLGDFLPSESVDGLDVFVDPYLVPKYMVGISTGAAVYGGPPNTDIRVVDVSLLGVDVGVYFFGSTAVEFPAAFSYVPAV
jgi:hypothetical protein